MFCDKYIHGEVVTLISLGFFFVGFCLLFSKEWRRYGLMHMIAAVMGYITLKIFLGILGINM